MVFFINILSTLGKGEDIEGDPRQLAQQGGEVGGEVAGEVPCPHPQPLKSVSRVEHICQNVVKVNLLHDDLATLPTLSSPKSLEEKPQIF